MLIAGKTFRLTAEEREPNSFEYVSGRHHLLMSKTMSGESLPTTWFSPVDLLLSALAGCLGITFRTHMEEAGLKFENLRIEIEGVRPEGADRPGIQSVKTKVFVRTDADPVAIRRIVEKSEEVCTVRNTVDHCPIFGLEVVIE